MYVSISEIDLVEVLNLDKSMSVGEIDIILENLSKETYFRFLFEELPKLLKRKDYDEISEKYKTNDDIDELMDELVDRWPDLHIEFRLQVISNAIKKEFIVNYLSKMKKDFSDKDLHQNIDKLILEINKEQINKDLCWKIKDEMGKKINIINNKK
ncbi:MAG: hypothetical protein WC894_06065 [Patescibacteria group bacterium]